MFFNVLVRLGEKEAGIHVKKVIFKKSQIFNLVEVHHYNSIIS